MFNRGGSISLPAKKIKAMIIRKKNIKANPESLLSIQVDIEPTDVVRMLRAYLLQLNKCAPELVTQGAMAYSIKEIEGIISSNSIVHHFTPSVQRIVYPWLIEVAKREKLITQLSPRVAEALEHYEEAYSINDGLLLK